MFVAFHTMFPEIGTSETRIVRPFDEHGITDTYLFLELYCDEPGCDCRRVLVNVISERAAEAGGTGHVATLTFGWEPLAFYRAWAGAGFDAEEVADLKGPALQRLAPQTERSGEMLGHFRTLLADPAYIERLKRHYAMLRAKVDGPGAESQVPMNRAARRAKSRQR